MNSEPSHQDQTKAAPAWFVPLFTLVSVVAAIAYFWLMRAEPYDGDSANYIAIASGHIADVHKPFTARLLQPALAGFMSRTTGLSVDAMFFATNVISLAVLAGAGLIFVTRQVRSLAFAVALVVCPVILIRFREIYLPDCAHAALVAVFFLLLLRGARWFAMPLFTLLQVTRESTVLLTFVVAVVALFKRTWKLAVAAVLFTAIGMGIVSRYAGSGQGNIHGLNTIAYLTGKVPYASLLNVTGVRLWTDSHAKNDPASYSKTPLWVFKVPGWARIGAVRELGVYDFEPDVPLANARMLLTEFGVMPTLVLMVVVWKRLSLMREGGMSEAGLIALNYGSIALLMSPTLGTAFGRYLSYSWPLAWIAAPDLVKRYFNTSGQLLGQLACLQVVACWTPLVLGEQANGTVLKNLIAIGVALVCHGLAIRLLRRNRVAAEPS
jgi:hypothetical protein